MEKNEPEFWRGIFMTEWTALSDKKPEFLQYVLMKESMGTTMGTTWVVRFTGTPETGDEFEIEQPLGCVQIVLRGYNYFWRPTPSDMTLNDAYDHNVRALGALFYQAHRSADPEHRIGDPVELDTAHVQTLLNRLINTPSSDAKDR